jgi:hypothetical protein
MSLSRLIYVEDDPALRGIMGVLLASQEIDVILSSVSPTDTLAVRRKVLNGLDLGIDMRVGCSIMPKTEDMKIQDLPAPAGVA